MSDFVSLLLQWLNDHPQLAGLFTFLISAAESVAILGTIVPGSIMMTAIGTLAGAGVIPLWETIIWAILGAIVGDGISYWMGHYFKEGLYRVPPFRSYPGLLKSGERFFHKYGSMSVFIGRFVGPVRALVPLVAGMLGMRPLNFYIANITSAIGWAPAYMLPGILLGAASLELPPDIAVHVILALFLIFLFIMLCCWFVYILFKMVQNQVIQLQNTFWLSLKNSRYFSKATVILKHYDKGKTYGQFNLALLLLLTIALFLTLVFYVKFAGPENIVINDVMYHLFRGMSIRNSHLDHAMLNITLLGQLHILIPVTLVIFVYLLISKRPRAAWHTLLLTILALGSVYALKHIAKIPRPWGVFHNPETYSMPSGHAAIPAAFYIGLALLITSSLSKRQWILTILSAIVVLLIGISRLYLGVHWFTDILGGWLLGAALLTFIIISYNRHHEKPVNAFGLLTVSLVALIFFYGFIHHFYYPQIKQNYTQIDLPVLNVSIQDWWHKNEFLPAYRTSLFGFRSSKINIEWAGDLEKIKNNLIQEGWEKPPVRDLQSTVHRIADISSAEYLPLVSPQYLDKKPTLTLTRYSDDQKSLIVLRLWDSNYSIQELNKKLWVGVLGIVPRSYSWLYKKSAGEITIDPMFVFPKKIAAKEWNWKLIFMNSSPPSRLSDSQTILLIRPKK